jgi:hypothetical protein
MEGVKGMPENQNTINVSGPLSADDLLRLGLTDDPLLLEDPSLCTVCSVTCGVTAPDNQ